MELNTRITAAVSAAVTGVMNDYAEEQAGEKLPPLLWTLAPRPVLSTPSWGLIGHVSGADYAEAEVAQVLAHWARAQVLNLTQIPDHSRLSGSVEYAGTIDGRHVRIWGVVDRELWEHP
jgi:hypothetical protein